MNFGFSFLQGIFAFILLILFLLFYFKTSKTVKKTFYPIMFFKSVSLKSKRKFFLKYFFRNKYFFIQLLILFLFLLLFLKPFFIVKNNSFLNNNIIVVDTSASTSKNFKNLISTVKKNLGSKNTIILSGKPARIFLEDSNYQNAVFKLSFLKPEIKSSDFENALILAYDKIKEKPYENYNVLIVTDLKSKLPSTVNFLKSKNISVSIIPIENNNNNNNYNHNNGNNNNNIDNVGFVNYDFKNNNVYLKVKNFGNKTKNVVVQSKLKKVNFSLNPFSFKTIVFPLNEKENIIKLYSDNDYYDFDNTFYFYNPSKKNVNVLLITTKNNNSVEKALKSINYVNVNIDKNKLGVINKNYDIIILYEYNPKLLLPSFFNDIKNQNALIVISKTKNINSLNSILPFKFFSQKEGSFKVFKKQNFVLNNNVDFSTVKNPYSTFLEKNNTIVLAETKDNNIVVSYTKNNIGRIIYFGYDDNDVFKNTPSFPLFFSNIVDFSSGINDFYKYNIDTNRILEFNSKKTIFYPNKKIPVFENTVNFNTPGFYNIDNNILAVNFFDEEESNPFVKENYTFIKKNFKTKVDKKLYLNNILLFLILLLLFLELYFMKKDLLI